MVESATAVDVVTINLDNGSISYRNLLGFGKTILFLLNPLRIILTATEDINNVNFNISEFNTCNLGSIVSADIREFLFSRNRDNFEDSTNRLLSFSVI